MLVVGVGEQPLVTSLRRRSVLIFPKELAFEILNGRRFGHHQSSLGRSIAREFLLEPVAPARRRCTSGD